LKIVIPATAILFGLLAGGFHWRSHRTARLTDKDTIVLADFTNMTGDPVFDGALRQGLSVQLDQSPLITLLLEEQIQHTLRFMGMAPDVRLTPQIAREVCQRTHDIERRKTIGRTSISPHTNGVRRMMQDAHERRFDVVVVWRFDRFARSVSHLLRALETFNSLGVQFVSLSEQVDTSTPTGKMVFTVLGAVAELERNLIVERVRAGLRHARFKGKRLGRPVKIVDPANVLSMRANGSSWRAIARHLGLSVGTVFAAGRKGETSN
jgi:DNA invertase Pin-like site-specific DNA recombinase